MQDWFGGEFLQRVLESDPADSFYCTLVWSDGATTVAGPRDPVDAFDGSVTGCTPPGTHPANPPLG